MVVGAQGDAHGFAEALAALAQQRWSAYDAAIAANGGHLMNRIRRLLDPRRQSSRFIARARIFQQGLSGRGLTQLVSDHHTLSTVPPAPQALRSPPRPIFHLRRCSFRGSPSLLPPPSSR